MRVANLSLASCDADEVVVQEDEQIDGSDSRGEMSQVLRPGKYIEADGVRIQVEDTADVEVALAEERKEGLQNMEQDLSELAELYQDVATLTQEQQEEINVIQDTVESAATKTAGGVEEINKVGQAFECH